MLVQVQIKGGLVKRTNQVLMKSLKLKHSFTLLSKSILIHKEDISVVTKVLNRNFIPYIVK